MSQQYYEIYSGLTPTEKISKYYEDGWLARWFQAGASIAQVIDWMHVTSQGWNAWVCKHKDEWKKLVACRKPVLAEAWLSLIKLSQGYSVPIHKTHRQEITRPNGETQIMEETWVEEQYIPPKPTAVQQVIMSYSKVLKENGQSMIPQELVYPTYGANVQIEQKDNGKMDDINSALQLIFNGGNNETEQDVGDGWKKSN